VKSRRRRRAGNEVLEEEEEERSGPQYIEGGSLIPGGVMNRD